MKREDDSSLHSFPAELFDSVQCPLALADLVLLFPLLNPISFDMASRRDMTSAVIVVVGPRIYR